MITTKLKIDERKIKAVINGIEDDIVQYNKELLVINKNKYNYQDIYEEAEAIEIIAHFEGRINEARHIKNKLEKYISPFYNEGEKNA